MLKLPGTSGTRIGEEVLQLYIHDLVASRVRPVRELKGFQKAPFHKKTKGGGSKVVDGDGDGY